MKSKSSLSLKVLTLILLASIAMAVVPADKTNLPVLGNGMGVYGKTTSGLGIPLIQINNSNQVQLGGSSSYPVVIATGDIYTTDWTNYITPNLVVAGFATTGLSASLNYQIVGKRCYVLYAINGTSTSTAFTFTLPKQSKAFLTGAPVPVYGEACVSANDNTTALTTQGKVLITSGSKTANVYPSPAQGPWTASGTKSAYGSFWYTIE